jgi:hypothetical protein
MDSMYKYCLIPLLIIIFIGAYVMYKKTKREGYRDPIFLSKKKLEEDYYPRTSGSIYGVCSNIFSGFPYYSNAY